MSARQPQITTIAGVQVVTIPLEHYAELLDCKRMLSERAISHDQLLSPRRSRIERNPEVAVYLAQNFGLLPMGELLRKCRRRFGTPRTPSIAAAYRYWQKIKREAAETGTKMP
ncbi:hypothetical protein [Ensifer aridi]|uniref:hypothetical protein n=1 Tax=Ensifer aridi TaxID=1708715 RepID=UPI00111BEA2F|nr:hypothetical protein [Ensifer aridi]